MHSMCIRKMMFVFELFKITDEITFNKIYAFNVHKKDDVCFQVVHNY